MTLEDGREKLALAKDGEDVSGLEIDPRGYLIPRFDDASLQILQVGSDRLIVRAG